MIRFKFIPAFCLGLALVATTTAHAQSAVLVARTLTLAGTNATDVLEVLPNTGGDGYVVQLNGVTRPIFDANQGRNLNVVPSNLVDSIDILGGSGNDFIYLGENFLGENVFDVNANLDVFINAGSGNDVIDPGVTGFNRSIMVLGSWGGDTLHTYYTLLGGVRLYLSPQMADLDRMDRIITHRVGGTDQFPTFRL